jgi:SAM-dependent methyltransferase
MNNSISRPSLYHNNRRAYNWLIYDNGDKWLLEYSKYYKGILVDLGCGTAPYKKFFLQFADEYIGVDWTNSLHNSKADIVSNLNKKIELDDQYADTIISISVLEHLCEPQNFLNESYRVLKYGGNMILQVPWMWMIHEAPYDYFRYTPYGLKYMFEKAGFKDVHVQPIAGFFTTIFIKINYFSLRLIKGSNLQKKITRLSLLPFWYLSQKIAPWLDSLHRGWSLETAGFMVVAKKRRDIA